MGSFLSVFSDRHTYDATRRDPLTQRRQSAAGQTSDRAGTAAEVICDLDIVQTFVEPQDEHRALARTQGLQECRDFVAVDDIALGATSAHLVGNDVGRDLPVGTSTTLADEVVGQRSLHVGQRDIGVHDLSPSRVQPHERVLNQLLGCESRAGHQVGLVQQD